MAPTELNVTGWTLRVPDEAATAALAASLAPMLRVADFVSLSGDLGAGKTTFARTLIRVLQDDPELEVPSPTFTLLQSYDGGTVPIVHADLYRIRNADELAEIGWDEALDQALVLVEWPDRLGDRLPADRLDVAFKLLPDGPDAARSVTLTGRGEFASRLRRAKGIATLLESAGYAGARRTFMVGDASTRAYERLTEADGRTAVLMISPPRADAPAVRFGRPYHHVARLAGDIRPFLAMDQALAREGVSVPQIHASDPGAGIAILEDFGAEPVVRGTTPIAERYLSAIGVLAELHERTLPEVVPGVDGTPYAIPPYDLDAYLIEAELLIDWYAPQIAQVTLPASARALFLSVCGRMLRDVLSGPKTWCLRDFHSPNLIWLPGRRDGAQVGVLDFQDCVVGHPAYDVASLLQDARVDVPDALELKLLGAYAQHRRAHTVFFDMSAFAESYAILGVQRATKILGAFARLDKRDRKPQYLAHLPRIEGYLAKGLKHPALAELRAWYQTYLPGVFPGGDGRSSAL